MGNKARGIVKINDDYSLRYTTNALVEMEEEMDMPIQQIIKLFETGRLGFKAIRVIVWAGLIHQFDNGDGTYDLTLREAGDLIDEIGLDAMIEKVGDALAAQFPNETERPSPNREQRRQGVKTEKN